MDNRIRVLNITKSTGGLAHYNYRLCQGVDANRFDMHVLCLSEDRERYAQELEDDLGVTTYTLDMDRYSINPLSDLRLVGQVRDLVQQGKFDVLLGHGSKAGYITRIVGKITNIPAIYGLASMSFMPRIHGNKAYLYRLLEYSARLFGGHIVTLSHMTSNELVRMRLSAPDNISVIHTGIDIETYKPNHTKAEACETLGLDANRLIVGWAARFAPQKDPLAFIQLVAKVVAQVPDVQIFMAGEGDLKPEAIALAKSLGVDEHIVFAPWQTDVPLMLSAFDVYVLNSRWEGLPQSLLEAMAMECACVVHAVDGNVEVIEHGVSGYLVPLDDLDTFAGHIIDLLQNDDQRMQMRKASRERVQDAFTFENMIERWETLFTQLPQAHQD